MKTISLIAIVVFSLALIILIGTLADLAIHTNTVPPANIDVQVVYAYIGHPTVSNNNAGFNYKTAHTSTNYNLTSYAIILKVTNNGAKMVSMTQFRATVAEQIIENKIGFNDSNGNPAPGGLGGPMFQIGNPMISDTRSSLQTGGFSNYLDAGKSRLIALTGLVSLNKFSEQRLENLTVSVWGSVTAQTGYASGQSAWTPSSQGANDVKQIVFQNVGGDYLYNQLVGSNQTLLIDGLSAEVISS